MAHCTTCAALLAMFVGSFARADLATIQLLGDLPGGYHRSEVRAISPDGLAVVGSSSARFGDTSDPGVNAFRWMDATGIADLGNVPGWAISEAKAVSNSGEVAVGTAQYGPAGSGSMRAFRWTSVTGMQDLGTLGGTYSYALGVSANGTTIVGASGSPQGGQAYRWTSSEGMTGLGFLPGSSTTAAVGVSEDGGVIAGYGSGGASQPFLWTPSSGMVGLGIPAGSVGATARAISVDGSTLVGQDYRATGQRRGYRWTETGGFEDLGDPPTGGLSVNPLCVSGNGARIGGWYGMPVEDDPDAEWIIPFLWDAQHGVRDLKQVLLDDYGLDEIANWGLSLEGISADGTALAGTAYFHDEFGQWVNEGFLIRLPEPQSFLLMLVAFSCVEHFRCSRRRS